MLFSKKSQLHLSTICILCTIAIYAFLSARYRRLPQQHVYQHNVEVQDGSSQLGQTLHPEDHIHRIPKLINLRFNITVADRRPDGVKKKIYLINGQFPGPTIEAISGDELVVEVQNSLPGDEGVAIHWHGLSMRNANEMDGTVGVTQSPIPPMGSFVYRFKIEDNQAGTFWYHAHSEVQRADGLYGGFIVHRPASEENSDMTRQNYDEDLLLLIGDWYHRSATEILDYYRDWTNFGAEIKPAPDSLVINGLGAFNCSMAVPARPLQCEFIAPPQLSVSGRRTRLRIVNTGALTGFTISTSGYEMIVYEVDGGNAVSSAAAAAADSVGILYPGERMDVLLERTDDGRRGRTEITVEFDPENLRFPNLALSPIQTFPVIATLAEDERPKLSDGPLNPSSRFYDLSKISGPVTTNLPEKADQTYLFYTKIEILSEFRNIPKGFINRTSWDPANANSPPLLTKDRNKWQDDLFVPNVMSGPNTWIDLVVNNRDDKGHPFHLHGYDFYVLSSHKSRLGSYDAYNPFDRSKSPAGGPMNTFNPPKKDTVLVPRMGYVVLRFLADNKGLWFFHCHVLWHEAVGMAMAFQVGD